MFDIVSGRIKLEAVTLFSIVKDEMFYLHAFFDHYRKLGVGQFIILDDKSVDGTAEFLGAQADCVVIRSKQEFGEILPSGERAGIQWKSLIPQTYCKDRWALYVDADELVFLPGISSLGELSQHLEQLNVSAIGAVLIDFYPGTIDELGNHERPASREALVSRYPFFDSCRHLAWKNGELRPEVLNSGVRERLMREFGIDKHDYDSASNSIRKLAKKMLRRFSGKPNITSIHKVPFVKWTEGKTYLNSHTLNEAPYVDLVLPIAHFKFTASLDEKIRTALRTGAYSQGSRNYKAYRDLLEAMREKSASFMCEDSARFIGAEDLHRRCCR